MQMKIFPTIMAIIFWSFTVFQNRFDLTKVRRDLYVVCETLFLSCREKRISKMGSYNKVSNLPSRNKFLAITIKNYSKQILKFSAFVQFCFVFYFQPYTFVTIIVCIYFKSLLQTLSKSLYLVYISVLQSILCFHIGLIFSFQFFVRYLSNFAVAHQQISGKH